MQQLLRMLIYTFPDTDIRNFDSFSYLGKYSYISDTYMFRRYEHIYLELKNKYEALCQTI
jgi:hypothetical protein